jgi:hypothetical protein
MSHSLLEQKSGSAAKTPTLTKPTAVDPLPSELCEHLQRLHLILPVSATQWRRCVAKTLTSMPTSHTT